MTHTRLDAVTQDMLRRLVSQDLHHATSAKDLARRLARNGFALEQTGSARKLVTLPHRIEVMDLSELQR